MPHIGIGKAIRDQTVGGVPECLCTDAKLIPKPLTLPRTSGYPQQGGNDQHRGRELHTPQIYDNNELFLASQPSLNPSELPLFIK